MPRQLRADSAKLIIGLALDDSLDSNDGVQQYVLTLGRWLSKQGHEVHYICGQTDRRKLGNLHSLSKNFRIKFNGNWLSVPWPVSQRMIQSQLGDINLDVLHVQMPFSPLMSGKVISWLKPSTAVIGTFHILPYGKLATVASRGLGLLSRRSIKRFDTILAVSVPAQDLVAQMYLRQATVLGNAFDFKRFSKAAHLQTAKELKILFLGRLVPRKGCMDLLNALALIKSSKAALPAYHLTIAGDGPLKSKLMRYCRRHQLESSVRFAGYVSESAKVKYLAQADIAVFPSYSGESFGIVLLEAMANGHTAVLAADNPGYKALLKNNPQSLFKARDSVDLANKLTRLFMDPALRQSMALKGQNLARQYDVSVIGERLVEYYRTALHKRQS